MSDTLAIKIDTSAAREAAAKLDPRTMAQAIAGAMDSQNQFTISHISVSKLSSRGPTTLGVRTNRLRGSVRASKAEINGTNVTSSIGSNVKYAGVHEFGFSGTQSVKPFTRRNRRGDVFSRGPRGGKKKVASGISIVRAFSRKVKFPARRMFQTGIEERVPAYSAAISEAIVKAWTP